MSNVFAFFLHKCQSVGREQCKLQCMWAVGYKNENKTLSEHWAIENEDEEEEKKTLLLHSSTVETAP